MGRNNKIKKNKIFYDFELVENLLRNETFKSMCNKFIKLEPNLKYRKMYEDFSKKNWCDLSFSQKGAVCAALRFKLGYVNAYKHISKKRDYTSDLVSLFVTQIRNHKYL